MDLSSSEDRAPCVGSYHIYIRACTDLNLTSTLPTMSNMFGYDTVAPSSPLQMIPRTSTPSPYRFASLPSSPVQRTPRTGTTFGGIASESPRSLSSSTLNPLASSRSPSTAGVPGSFGPGSTGSLTRPSTPVNHPVQDHSKTVVSDVRVAKKDCLE